MSASAEAASRRVPMEKRKRTEISCDRCKARKQKCLQLVDQRTCQYCRDHGKECITTVARKKRIYGSIEGVGTRIALLESLVKGLIPEADLSSIEEMRALGRSLGIALPVETTLEDVETIETGKHEDAKPDEEQRLLQDQQGQVQYIGPASSYFFQMRLRTLFGHDANPTRKTFYLFGGNPTDTSDKPSRILNDSTSPSEMGDAVELPQAPSTQAATPRHGPKSPVDELPDIEPHVIESLVGSYFDKIHPDFPVLHEASFREAYESWTASPTTADRTWLCGLYCVLILARRVASIAVPSEQEDRCWRRVQVLLPTVLFTSNVSAVQALMLAALHLHNTNHRDACWTLTGAAVRIAFAIGLHRDGIKTMQTPLTRELRKRLWWTLYGFEQIQVSSHDRPSAIDDAVCSASCPRESILDLGGQNPPDLMMYSNRLGVMLGSACRAIRPVRGAGTAPAEDAPYHTGPLSPVAGLLRELTSWKQALPSHLCLESVDSLPPSFQRPLLLLHIQYYHIVSLISRPALVSRAAMLSKQGGEMIPSAALSTSETCIDAGRMSSQLLLKLDKIGKFNGSTWWDTYYTYSAALLLVLDVISAVLVQRKSTQRDPSSTAASSQSRALLRDCAALASRQLQNPMLPGTMHRWATVVSDLESMTDEFVHGTRRPLEQNRGDRPDRNTVISPTALSSANQSHDQTRRGARVGEASGRRQSVRSQRLVNQVEQTSSSFEYAGAVHSFDPPGADVVAPVYATLPAATGPMQDTTAFPGDANHNMDISTPTSSAPLIFRNDDFHPTGTPHGSHAGAADDGDAPMDSARWSQFSSFLDPEDAQFWHQVHWEDIGNMLWDRGSGST